MTDASTPSIRHFEDIMRLDDENMLELNRHIEIDDLGKALRGAPEGVSDQFFRNMSYRAGLMTHEVTLSRAVTAMPMEEIEKERRRIVNVISELLEAGVLTLANPNGPIHPERSADGSHTLCFLMSVFHNVLAWDKKKLRAEARYNLSMYPKLWATALHPLAVAEREAFFAKLPWEITSAIRKGMDADPHPRPEDVELARLTIGDALRPPTVFTVKIAKEIYGNPGISEELPPTMVWEHIRDHRATMVEAMGEEWVRGMEKVMPKPHSAWKSLCDAVARIFSTEA
jgi:Flagellar motor switch protein